MKINECMTREFRIVDPAETVQDAARKMADIDAGFLPVGEDDRLIGIVTDRDIAIRAVAVGRDHDAKVRDVMSQEIRYCYVDDEVSDVLSNMAELQVRRLPVVDHDKRLVGIISIGDLTDNGLAAQAGETLCRIVRPSGLHSQTI